jgi:hypothetical protein
MPYICAVDSAPKKSDPSRMIGTAVAKHRLNVFRMQVAQVVLLPAHSFYEVEVVPSTSLQRLRQPRWLGHFSGSGPLTLA